MAFLIILLMCSIFINIVFGYGFIHFYNEWRIDEKIIKKANEVLEEDKSNSAKQKGESNGE